MTTYNVGQTTDSTEGSLLQRTFAQKVARRPPRMAGNTQPHAVPRAVTHRQEGTPRKAQPVVIKRSRGAKGALPVTDASLRP